MAIKYKELIQDDEVGDELIKDTKNSKKDFDSLQCKCEHREDEDENDDDEDEDDYVEFTWSEIGKSMLTFKIEFNIHFLGKRLVFFFVTLTVFALFHLCFYYLASSVWNLVSGDQDTLGQQNLLVRQEEYLMTRSLEEEELRQLGRLDLLRMEMEEIGNMEMAAEYGDKSYWFKRKMGNIVFET